jgi:YHS domain-containing protein
MVRCHTLLVLLAVFALAGCPGSKEELAPPPASPSASPTLDPSAKPVTTPTDTPDTPVAKPPAGPEGLDGSQDAEQAIGLMASSKDVVCGKDVGLNTASVTHVWGDTTFLFCGAECAGKFKANPKGYVKKR